ncbi:Uncharacterized protein APZ42_005566 [Daphnia magna]|uniref:Uncharacterized protein n=1 Tax=Daphnia magna TaxID=35525 RepID=A0A164GDK1_9CRUS|nr:Uncharacterized protein APZ42_005566 [Daphnia magna]
MDGSCPFHGHTTVKRLISCNCSMGRLIMTHLHLMVSWMNSGTVNWTRFSIPRRISGCCRRRSGLHLS